VTRRCRGGRADWTELTCNRVSGALPLVLTRAGPAHNYSTRGESPRMSMVSGRRKHADPTRYGRCISGFQRTQTTTSRLDRTARYVEAHLWRTTEESSRSFSARKHQVVLVGHGCTGVCRLVVSPLLLRSPSRWSFCREAELRPVVIFASTFTFSLASGASEGAEPARPARDAHARFSDRQSHARTSAWPIQRSGRLSRSRAVSFEQQTACCGNPRMRTGLRSANRLPHRRMSL